MRAPFATIFGVLFCLSHALAQLTLPVFPSKQDSATYAANQSNLDKVRKLASEQPPGTPLYDSLMKVSGQLMREQMTLLATRGVIMRTIYRSDPTMTSYGELVRNGKPADVRRLSITGSGRSRL